MPAQPSRWITMSKPSFGVREANAASRTRGSRTRCRGRRLTLTRSATASLLMFPLTSTARNRMLSPVARKSDPPYRWQGPRLDRVVDARQTDIVGGIQGYRETALNRDDRRRGDRRKFVGPHAAILLAIVIQYESFLRRIGAQSVTLPPSTTNPAHWEEVVT
jgi:hypothetical protein